MKLQQKRLSTQCLEVKLETGVSTLNSVPKPYQCQDNICIFYALVALHCLLQPPLRLKSPQLLLPKKMPQSDQLDCNLSHENILIINIRI